jgi:hypothetical protein
VASRTLTGAAAGGQMFQSIEAETARAAATIERRNRMTGHGATVCALDRGQEANEACRRAIARHGHSHEHWPRVRHKKPFDAKHKASICRTRRS